MTAVQHRLPLPPTAASAGAARRFVESVLTAAHQEALAYTATVLVSELVANAVLHTATSLEVVVAVDEEGARVEVHDGSPQLPVRKRYSAMSGTGRGLMMVDRMATHWGAEPTATGKVVWFDLGPERTPALDDLFEIEIL
ncbi:MAG TPA: ATP-binding protein [Acidimicrobiales bacterium]|jgi:anti-sigma regulatory factor (Ser/Thr protein kinase)|nr:ATP-binding protein [Acidimicrobiales bacterium]